MCSVGLSYQKGCWAVWVRINGLGFNRSVWGSRIGNVQLFSDLYHKRRPYQFNFFVILNNEIANPVFKDELDNHSTFYLTDLFVHFFPWKLFCLKITKSFLLQPAWKYELEPKFNSVSWELGPTSRKYCQLKGSAPIYRVFVLDLRKWMIEMLQNIHTLHSVVLGSLNCVRRNCTRRQWPTSCLCKASCGWWTSDVIVTDTILENQVHEIWWGLPLL